MILASYFDVLKPSRVMGFTETSGAVNQPNFQVRTMRSITNTLIIIAIIELKLYNLSEDELFYKYYYLSMYYYTC